MDIKDEVHMWGNAEAFVTIGTKKGQVVLF